METLIEIKCPECGSKDVVQTTTVEHEDWEYGVFRCDKCGKIFTEEDVVEDEEIVR